MKIETKYTTGPVTHMSVWSDLEIICKDGSTIVVEMSTEDMKNLADRLLSRVQKDQEREFERLKEALDPTELIEE